MCIRNNILRIFRYYTEKKPGHENRLNGRYEYRRSSILCTHSI